MQTIRPLYRSQFCTAGRLRLVVLTFVLVASGNSLTAAEPQPAKSWAELMAEQGRLGKQFSELAAAGKTNEAIASAKMLITADRNALAFPASSEREKTIQDDLRRRHVPAAFRWLVETHLKAEAWSTAAKTQNQLAGFFAANLGETDYRTLEARYVCQYFERLANLEPEVARELVNASKRVENIYDLNAGGKYSEAIPRVLEVVKLQEKLLGDSSPILAAGLDNLGWLHFAQDDLAGAEGFYRRAMDIRKKTLGENHPRYAASLVNLANLYDRRGEYACAEPLCRQALSITKKALGENGPAYAHALQSLAHLYVELGDYASAEPLCRKALEIEGRANGKNTPGFAALVDNLAMVYKLQGNYARAEPLYRQALEITKNALGENHPDYAASLNNLAQLYKERGDYRRAELFFRQAAKVTFKTLGENHPAFAICLSNLAQLYKEQGEFALAEPLCQKALEIRKNALGENHREYALSLVDLASLYKAKSDYARAAPIYRQALEVLKRAVGENHPDYAGTLHDQALMYVDQGEYSLAEPIFRHALEIEKKVLGESHLEYAHTLDDLADLYRIHGDYTMAESNCRKALEITKKALGENHPKYARVLNNLFLVYLAQGEFARAEPLGRRAATIQFDDLQAAAVAKSERQQFLMLDSVRYYLDSYLALAANQDQFAIAAYRQALVWKGIVFRRERLLRAGEHSLQVIALFRQLQQVAGQLARQAWASPEPRQQEQWRKNAERLSSEKERLEAELSARSAPYRRAKKQITVEELQRALPADAVLVDFIEYAHCTPADKKAGTKSAWEQRLIAFIVRHDGPVVRINLGPAQIISEAIETWRESCGVSSRAAAAGKLLREKLWEPIEANLGGAKSVLVSPDGALCRLPLAALPGKDAGHFLIEDYTIAIVPTAQMIPELVQEEGRKPLSESLLIMGNIDYDAPGAAVPDAVADPTALASLSRAASVHFRSLAATQAEVAAIAKLCPRDSDTGGVITFEKDKASKAAFLAECGKHPYLHLATHGFFIEEKLHALAGVGSSDSGRFGEMLKGPGVAQMYPALRCGLALAGANRAATAGAGDALADKGEDNGILTAEEIGALNLDGVQLVVLSACETGLGKSAGGEGVLGLQRSFQAAGARNVVASLWLVDDRATQTLMVEFYKNLWEKKLGTLDALRKAQLTMLRRYDLKAGKLRTLDITDTDTKPAIPAAKPGKTASPELWAGFVLSGVGR